MCLQLLSTHGHNYLPTWRHLLLPSPHGDIYYSLPHMDTSTTPLPHMDTSLPHMNTYLLLPSPHEHIYHSLDTSTTPFPTWTHPLLPSPHVHIYHSSPNMGTFTSTLTWTSTFPHGHVYYSLPYMDTSTPHGHILRNECRHLHGSYLISLSFKCPLVIPCWEFRVQHFTEQSFCCTCCCIGAWLMR